MLEQRAQIETVDELERHEVTAVHHPEVEDLDDVRVSQLRRDARFLEEEPNELGVRFERRQDALQTNVLLERSGATAHGDERLGHPPRAESPLELVRPEAPEFRRHGDREIYHGRVARGIPCASGGWAGPRAPRPQHRPEGLFSRPVTDKDLGPSTLAVHGGDFVDASTAALDPPIVMSSTFAFEGAAEAAALFRGERDGYIYGRWRNPTVEALERKVAALERAEAAVAMASGMAAVSGAIGAFCSAGDRVLAPSAVYAEATRALSGPFARFGVRTEFVDTSDPHALESALAPPARLVWVETPANPTLAITDIALAAELAGRAGALLVVDSTFATPHHQTPLSLGADLVVHSATKALGGHGDAIGGVVAGSADLCASVRAHAVRTFGGAMAPLTAWLIGRGVRTLALRAERASASALEIAKRLERHPRIARVSYPGLESHPGHEVAKKQMRRGFGALLAFEVDGGVEAGRALYDRVELVTRAVSLGDVRSLLTHAASTTHASLTNEERARAGIGDGLIRLSVGIEDVEDIYADLERAIGR